MGRRPKNYVPPEEEIIECLACGRKKEDKEYYTSRWSRVFVTHNHKVPICRDCVQKLFDEYREKYGEKTALAVICANLDLPFLPKMYTQIIEKNNIFSLGIYIRQLQGAQYDRKAFISTVTELHLLKTEDKSLEDTPAETKWNKMDNQNRSCVISTVGYDPFENCGMTDDDKKYCFGVMAGYCDIEGIKDDGYKLVACIQITKTQLQVNKIDDEINRELMSNSSDENRIRKLTASKKPLLDSIAKAAQDNEISSAHNSSGAPGKNTLSMKMKEMLDDGYERIRVNLYDIKTSDKMRQIAELSAKAIVSELDFGDSDANDIMREQREIIEKLRLENEELTEENRNCKNELNALKESGKR